MSSHDEWVQYPTGKIERGSFCRRCKRYNARNCVNDIIIIKNKRVLLIKRQQNPQAEWWALIGGYIDWDETLEDSVRRELKEEVGLEVKEMKFLGVYSDPERDLDGRQNIGHCYIVKPRGEIKTEPTEVSEYGWFELDNLPEKIAFDHRKMLKDYKNHTNSIENKKRVSQKRVEVV